MLFPEFFRISSLPFKSETPFFARNPLPHKACSDSPSDLTGQ